MTTHLIGVCKAENCTHNAHSEPCALAVHGGLLFPQLTPPLDILNWLFTAIASACPGGWKALDFTLLWLLGMRFWRVVRHHLSVSPSADADECEMFGPEICRNGRCMNTVPGYKCFCSLGYLYDPGRLECVGETALPNQAHSHPAAWACAFPLSPYVTLVPLLGEK